MSNQVDAHSQQPEVVDTDDDIDSNADDQPEESDEEGGGGDLFILSGAADASQFWGHPADRSVSHWEVPMREAAYDTVY